MCEKENYIMENDVKAIVLKNVTVLFSELADKGYGRSITIDATDPAIQKAINAWVKTNNIKGGEPKYKEYVNKNKKTTLQYNFKISDYTKISGRTVDGKTYGESELGYNAKINLQARAYNYKNKFGEGVSASLDGIFVLEPAQNTVMSNIAE